MCSLRGCVSAKILEHLELHLCEKGEVLADVFDLIVGTSAGGLLSLALGALREKKINISVWIFLIVT